MKIRLPASRACYPASRNEPDRLLCWIPRHELEQLAAEGRVKPEVLEYYPSGLEVRLSREGFAEIGLDLGVDPKELYRAYQALRQAGALPESGVVAGSYLEQAARSTGGGAGALERPAPRDLSLAVPEPGWTEGDDPRTAMQRLLDRRKGQ
jgi:hypothetical protein